MSDERTPSIWKREISFKRGPKQPGNDPVAAAAGAAGEKAAPVSVWKKEISLRRKPKDLAQPVVAEPDVAQPVVAEPVLPEPVAPVLPVAEVVHVQAESIDPPQPEVDHSWLTQPLEEVSEPGPVPREAAEPAPPTLELVEPAAVLPGDLDPALVFEVEEAVGPAPTEAVLPVEAVLPIEAATVPTPEPPAAPAFDLPAPSDLPDLPDLAALASAPEQPVEAPAAAVPTAKVPFYKRELSLGKSKAPKPPKAAKETAKKPRLSRKEKAAAAEGWDDTDVRKPFYKRELSFGKKSPKPAAASPVRATAPVAAVVEPPAKVTKARRSLAMPSLTLPSRPKTLDAKGGAKKLVGLKIGASQLAAARIVNGDSPELLQAVRSPLEPGIVVGGELRDPEALAAALRDFFKEHGLPRRGVRLGIANNRIGVRTFEVTGIDDEKQLANAIRFRAQEVLPIPIEEAVLDYQVLGRTVDEEGNVSTRVLLVVAYRELVDRYLHACRKAGIQIVGIDLEAFALLRAIAAPHDPVEGSDRGALVAVSVGHERSTFAVSDGRTCEFTRVLEWGGWAMNVAIARALDLSPSEAEPLKRALSFAGADAPPDGFGQDQLDTARDAARRQLQSFARELVSSLQFYQNQPGSLGIGEIVVTGGTAHLPGLGAELERLIGVPVRVADPMGRVKVSKKVRDRDQVGSLAIAIGLGIED